MLKSGQKLGKYRIRRRLARGGFGEVYEAQDTIEGISVALKIPLGPVDEQTITDFRREARVAAKLEHPNVLPIKNADFAKETFFIAYPLGRETLADRLERRTSTKVLLDLAEQMLAALAHAHERGIIHCDVKPDNLIVFEDELIRLTDFGIAKIAQRTIDASASGSLGFMAPEQALGKPSARSDVFSAGLVLYKMLTGHVPTWPFDWPPPGFDRLRRHPPELHAFLQRALKVDTRKRFRDAGQMLAAFRPVKAKALKNVAGRRTAKESSTTERDRDWRAIRQRQFKQRYGKSLRLDHVCGHCEQPVDERMVACPWCGDQPLDARGESSFPAQCPRCTRGIKLDWHYCPWCYGAKIGPQSNRAYSDKRYTGTKCVDPSCSRKVLMPFMRYCPWCNKKVRKRWSLGSSKSSCPKCEGRIAPGFWGWCAWCGTEISGS